MCVSKWMNPCFDFNLGTCSNGVWISPRASLILRMSRDRCIGQKCGCHCQITSCIQVVNLCIRFRNPKFGRLSEFKSLKGPFSHPTLWRQNFHSSKFGFIVFDRLRYSWHSTSASTPIIWTTKTKHSSIHLPSSLQTAMKMSLIFWDGKRISQRTEQSAWGNLRMPSRAVLAC